MQALTHVKYEQPNCETLEVSKIFTFSACEFSTNPTLCCDGSVKSKVIKTGGSGVMLNSIQISNIQKFALGSNLHRTCDELAARVI
jgi:hypothetical protein